MFYEYMQFRADSVTRNTSNQVTIIVAGKSVWDLNTKPSKLRLFVTLILLTLGRWEGKEKVRKGQKIVEGCYER